MEKHTTKDSITRRPKRRGWRTVGSVLFLAFLIAGTYFILRRSASYVMQEDSGSIFGTTYSIKYRYDKDLNKEILAELNKVDASLSMFNQQSTLAKINRNETTQTDELLREVFIQGLQISKATNGAFDMTVGPLVNAWGFGFKQGIDVTEKQLDSLRAFVGYEKVKLVGNRLQKTDSRLMLDAGAIAKGYGVDRVARYLESKGIRDYMIEIGGEIRVKGKNAKTESWTIGIQRPQDGAVEDGSNLQTVLRLNDVSLATSGNYMNFYYKNGRKYAHTIDPRTGKPVQHSLLSASVLASDCATADAYATSFMVMGLEQAKKLLEKQPRLKAYFIYEDQGEMKVWYSPELERLIVK